MKYLFQWHACKLDKLSACIAKCMTTINKIYNLLTSSSGCPSLKESYTGFPTPSAISISPLKICWEFALKTHQSSSLIENACLTTCSWRATLSNSFFLFPHLQSLGTSHVISDDTNSIPVTRNSSFSFFPHYLRGFYTFQVVQDFFNQHFY